MGKFWNWLISEDTEEFLEREKIRHLKRIADRLEDQSENDDLLEGYETVYCPKCDEEIKLTRRQRIEIVKRGRIRVWCLFCKKFFIEEI